MGKKVAKTGRARVRGGQAHGDQSVVATFAKPLPLAALSPEDFERFMLALLHARYPDAQVHRYGDQGHRQFGVDIEVIFPNGTCSTFQCKRHKDFGPAKVKAAIAAHTRVANHKFLVLTRPASPRARDVIKLHAGWTLWDVENISAFVRQDLSPEAQGRLVDTFFRGQRFALLGQLEAGPWQSVAAFFRPFDERTRLFNHSWTLVGRDDEQARMLDVLDDGAVQLVMLVGAGGAGKSRLLKAVAEQYEAAHPATVVRILGPGADLTMAAIDELGAEAKLLIVDDAHLHADLGPLLHAAATPDRQLKLLLALRSYGRDEMLVQASRYALSSSLVRTLELGPLTIDQATTIAEEILKSLGAPQHWAPSIAQITYDCPLAVVIGAQLVAKDEIAPALLMSADTFRNELLLRFRDVIAGQVGDPADRDALRKLLRIIALVQPFQPEDGFFSELVKAVEGIDALDTARLVRALLSAGVLFKRGIRYRLAPDLLGDFILEEACIGFGGEPTGYVERVFPQLGATQFQAALLNLSALDWRLSHRSQQGKRLLDNIWGTIEPHRREVSHTAIDAVRAIAYYQPERALLFAEHLIGTDLHRDAAARILQRVAYTSVHRRAACEALWQLGANDRRELGGHPSHGIRILKELCAVTPGKPLEISQGVVDFALSLLGEAAAWQHPYSPLDVLEGALATEGHETAYQRGAFYMKPYLLRFSVLKDIRRGVIDAILKLIVSGDKVPARRAARSLSAAIRGPMGVMGIHVPKALSDRWAGEFADTLTRLAGLLSQSSVEAVTWFEIVRAIGGSPRSSRGTLATAAQRIMTMAPTDLRYRVIAAMIDPWRYSGADDLDLVRDSERWQKALDTLLQELLATLGDVNALADFLAEILDELSRASLSRAPVPFHLCIRVARASESFSRVVVERTLARHDDPLSQLFGLGLGVLLRADVDANLGYAQQAWASGQPRTIVNLTQAYDSYILFAGLPPPAHMALISALFESRQGAVIAAAMSLTRAIAVRDRRLALELLLRCEIGDDKDLAHQLLLNLVGSDFLSYDDLELADVEAVLARLSGLSDLHDYWVEHFLATSSERYPQRTLAFYLARADQAMREEDWSFRSFNIETYPKIQLRFRANAEWTAMLLQVRDWACGKASGWAARAIAADIFVALFSPFDDGLAAPLREWLTQATADEVRLLAEIASHAPPGFVFEQQAFVVELLTRARQYGDEVYDFAQLRLLQSAAHGVRESVAGEPSARDVRMHEGAVAMLKLLPRLSPAYRFYDGLRKEAERELESARREKEAMDDE